MIRSILQILIVVSLLHVGAEDAICATSSEFRKVYTDDKVDLELSGAGYKRFLMMRVLSVALYLEESEQAKTALGDIPKRLEVQYLVNISAAELRKATTRGIQKNVSKKDFASLKERIDQINRYYPSVRKGDKITITYMPDTGTEMAVNGNVKTVIEGADFAKAFFAIWIGEKPVDKKMKDVLLGISKRKDV